MLTNNNNINNTLAIQTLIDTYLTSGAFERLKSKIASKPESLTLEEQLFYTMISKDPHLDYLSLSKLIGESNVNPSAHDAFSNVPKEIMYHIFSFLTPNEVVQSGLVSKRFKELSSHTLTHRSDMVVDFIMRKPHLAMKFVQYYRSTPAYRHLTLKKFSDLTRDEKTCFILTVKDIKHINISALEALINDYKVSVERMKFLKKATSVTHIEQEQTKAFYERIIKSLTMTLLGCKCTLVNQALDAVSQQTKGKTESTSLANQLALDAIKSNQIIDEMLNSLGKWPRNARKHLANRLRGEIAKGNWHTVLNYIGYMSFIHFAEYQQYTNTDILSRFEYSISKRDAAVDAKKFTAPFINLSHANLTDRYSKDNNVFFGHNDFLENLEYHPLILINVNLENASVLINHRLSFNTVNLVNANLEGIDLSNELDAYSMVVTKQLFNCELKGANLSNANLFNTMFDQHIVDAKIDDCSFVAKETLKLLSNDYVYNHHSKSIVESIHTALKNIQSIFSTCKTQVNIGIVIANEFARTMLSDPELAANAHKYVWLIKNIKGDPIFNVGEVKSHQRTLLNMFAAKAKTPPVNGCGILENLIDNIYEAKKYQHKRT